MKVFSAAVVSLMWAWLPHLFPQTTINQMSVSIPAPESGPQIWSYKLTIGDLNGDGTPDVVINNGLAFLRVYFMGYDPMQSPPFYCISTYTLFSVPQPYQDWGDNARCLTVTEWVHDTPLIFDIDLDGKNELIYLQHIPEAGGPTNRPKVGSVGLQIWDCDISPTLKSRSTWELFPKFAVPVAQGLENLSETGKPYFIPETNYNYDPQTATITLKTGKRDFGSLSFHAANFRGRFLPQDIIVHPDDGRAVGLRVLGYDNGLYPSCIDLIYHQSGPSREPGFHFAQIPPSLPEWTWDQGHNFRAYDINFNGKEEIVGKVILSYDPDPQSNGAIVESGFVFINDPQQAFPFNNHPDHFSVMDFMSSYLDSNGKFIPSPGLEIVVAPQVSVKPNSITPSGPWVYRAVAKHSLDPSGRQWPRKILNLYYDQTIGSEGNNGALYDFPTLDPGPIGPITWAQPDPFGNYDYASQWDTLGNSFYRGGGTPSLNPDIQTVVIGNFIPDRPGMECIVGSRSRLTTGPSWDGSVHFIFGSTPTFPILSWDACDQIQNPGPANVLIPIDIWGSRADGVQIFSKCAFGTWATPPANHLFGIYRWTPVINPPPRYLHASVWSASVPFGVDNYSDAEGLAVADLFGDNREEAVFYKISGSTATLNVVYNPANDRSGPSPWAYLNYRKRKSSNCNYYDAVDYQALSNPKFIQNALPDGQIGANYGVQQDQFLIQLGVNPVSVVIGVEGCLFSSNDNYVIPFGEGSLPSGLQFSQLFHPIFGKLLIISGVPTEIGTKPFLVRFVPATQGFTSIERRFWITVKSSNGPYAFSSVPFIKKAGWDGAYLEEGFPKNLTIKAEVYDINGDIFTVCLFDLNDTFIGQLSRTPGTDLWSLTIPNVNIPNGSYFYKLIAFDLAGNRSSWWPFFSVPGSQSDEFCGDFEYPADQYIQTESTTPTIEWVELWPQSTLGHQPNYKWYQHGFDPAEKVDETGYLDVVVYLKSIPLQHSVKQVLATLRHNDPKVEPLQIALTQRLGQPYAYEGTFDTNQMIPIKKGWFGWGNYSVNAQVTTTDGFLDYRSDWWPRLRSHAPIPKK